MEKILQHKERRLENKGHWGMGSIQKEQGRMWGLKDSQRKKKAIREGSAWKTTRGGPRGKKQKPHEENVGNKLKKPSCATRGKGKDLQKTTEPIESKLVNPKECQKKESKRSKGSAKRGVQKQNAREVDQDGNLKKKKNQVKNLG